MQLRLNAEVISSSSLRGMKFLSTNWFVLYEVEELGGVLRDVSEAHVPVVKKKIK